ncbi:hypothetical protein DOY81_013484 [Sarcophaga bullata]|nr:hypothetical protein DOY81_013484 [Sarcophaga bullata]
MNIIISIQLNCLYSEELRIHKKAERKLESYKRKYNQRIKLLLLGTHGSGKSTFIRQMRLFYEKTYTTYDRQKYIDTIYHNIFAAMKIMISAMQRLQIPFETQQNALTNSMLIKYVDLNCILKLNVAYVTALKELWADSGIQECYLRRREYALLDSTKYFFSHLDRIADPYYVPNDEDLLRVREPAKAIEEYLFKYRKVEFHITGVGCQLSERRKWLHYFDNVTAIIFLVAISEYDQFSYGDDCRNCLRETLELLKTITQYDYFDDISIIFVFNKNDLFEEKIMQSHLKDYFPEYKGPQYDPLAARSFILDMFLKCISPQRRVYHYFTNSTDMKSENIVYVFTAVRDTILNLNLHSFNLV